MCGHFSQTGSKENLRKRFSLAEVEPELKPRYNVAPGQEAAVIIAAS